MKRELFAAVAACVLAAGTAYGQQVQWTQTLNLPKGLNLPRGVIGELLGVELGEPFAEAKAKMQKLAQEDPRNANHPRAIVEEQRLVFRDLPGQNRIQATYIGAVTMNRLVPGATQILTRESLRVIFSSPSSGHQVLGMERSIHYNHQDDQPRISELVARVADKFKAQAQPQRFQASSSYRFQFDNGRAVLPPAANVNSCHALHSFGGSKVEIINPKGDCDVVLEVKFNLGKSPDHAAAVSFVLSDNERTKANLRADFAFFEDYVRKVQSRSGAAPKL